ncbi:MAG: pentapeptide repeat-containing protein [Cyanobacteria bacterium P01_G01_bin.39]
MGEGNYSEQKDDFGIGKMDGGVIQGNAKVAGVIHIHNYYEYKKEVKSDPVNAAVAHLPCPYRGLFHFRPNDAELFFGREQEVAELVQATHTKNFIPVLGASGSGKSSIVFAGLVPKLIAQGSWQFTYFRPGDEPFHALAKALIPLYEPDLNRIQKAERSRELGEKLATGSFPLKDVFAEIEINFPNQKLLLIADQFEELFTLCSDEAIRHGFLNLLLAVFKSPANNLEIPPVLITTMRADFLGNALSYSPLAGVLKTEIQLIGAMSRENLSKVIIEPAAMLGVGFESGLVDRILNDVKDEPGNLALLEFTLTELWQKRTTNQLTHQAYDAIGQVRGALAKYAEKEYQKLGDKEQVQARQIFLQLVNLGKDNNHTRRRVNRQQLGENNWDLVTRKGGLADSRLVVTSLDNHEQETLEVVHEALIRHWKRLGQWLNEDRENLNKQRSIEDDAKQWDDNRQNTDYLLKNKRLGAAKEFQQEQHQKYPLSDLAREFIARSSKHQRNERVKSLGLFLIIPLIGTVIGGYFLVREIQLNAAHQLIQECPEKIPNCSGRIEALERLTNAKRSMKSYNLERANLGSANLESANLKSAYLLGADLEDANLIDCRPRRC